VVPMVWRSRITEVEPGRRFVDVQERGPYRSWQHSHELEPLRAGGVDGTLVRDRIVYRLPLGPLGRLGLPLVRRQLEQLFDFRKVALERRFSAPAP
jgi:ligand-binding SRPBCC domain-containing protein